MKVDQTFRAQKQAFDVIAQQQQHSYPTLAVPSAPPMGSSPLQSPVYPDLVDYMGLELSYDMIAANMPEYLRGQSQQLTSYVPPAMPNNMVAPLSGNSIGLARAGSTNGIRELILCKDGNGKVGLRVQSINKGKHSFDLNFVFKTFLNLQFLLKGVFVCVVVRDSPAALAGLRFGDQILQINSTTVAGFSVDDVHKLLRKSSHNNISVVIRDRPFERIVTLHKDSSNCIGFQFKNGKITSIVKDSSAARNGLLIEHQVREKQLFFSIPFCFHLCQNIFQLLEIDGQNVVSFRLICLSKYCKLTQVRFQISLKDKEIIKIIANAERVITITIMPTFLYDHMMKKLSASMIKDKMDHSIPDF